MHEVEYRGLKITPEQAQAVDKIVRFIVRFGLVVPAILMLETMRPLSFIGSQFMHVLSPSITAILNVSEWDQMAHLLEDRRGLDYVIHCIEVADQERKTQ